MDKFPCFPKPCPPISFPKPMPAPEPFLPINLPGQINFPNPAPPIVKF